MATSLPNRARGSSRPGFTLLEMLVTATVLFSLVGLSYSLARASVRNQVVQTTAAALDSEGRRALEAMAEEIRQARLLMVQPQAPGVPGATTVLVFQEVESMVGMATMFGPSTTYAYQWNPWTSCGEITRTQDEITNVLVSHVRPNGFRVSRNPSNPKELNIRIEMEMAGPDGIPVVHTVETAVLPRN